MVTVFGVEASVVYEINAASDDISGSESGAIRLASAGRTKRMAVVTVVTVRVFIPSGKTVHIHALRRKTNSHVPVDGQ